MGTERDNDYVHCTRKKRGPDAWGLTYPKRMERGSFEPIQLKRTKNEIEWVNGEWGVEKKSYYLGGWHN